MTYWPRKVQVMGAEMTYSPRKVGLVKDQPIPAHLPDVGTVVTLANGKRGVVEEYEFYHSTQISFPVRREDGVAITCRWQDVTF